jgi:hypothetical protein
MIFGMKADHALKYVVDKICKSVLVSIATTLGFEFIPDKFNKYIIGKMHSYTRRHIGVGV